MNNFRSLIFNVILKLTRIYISYLIVYIFNAIIYTHTFVYIIYIIYNIQYSSSYNIHIKKGHKKRNKTLTFNKTFTFHKSHPIYSNCSFNECKPIPDKTNRQTKQIMSLFSSVFKESSSLSCP